MVMALIPLVLGREYCSNGVFLTCPFLVAIKNVTDSDDLMIINKSGIAIRMAVEDLRVMGRATQGVRLIKVREDDSIAAVAKVMHDDDDEIDLDEDGNEIIPEENGTAIDTDDSQTEINE
jgi:DNA gyrase subunit A